MASKRWGVIVMCVLGMVASTAAQTGQECGKDALDRINFYRSQHGAEALQTDKALADSAKANAEQLAKDNCAQKGGKPSAVWKCLGKACVTCPNAVDRWYWLFNDNFKFNTERLFTDNLQTFQFWGSGSSMLWMGAKKAACAWSSGGNCMIVSCMFDTGNIRNDQAFKDNLKPKKGGTPGSGPVQQQLNNQQPGQQQQQTQNGGQQPGPDQQPQNGQQQQQPQNFRVDSGPIPELPACPNLANSGLCASGMKVVVNGEMKDIASWCPVSCGPNNNFQGMQPFQPQNNPQQQQQNNQQQSNQQPMNEMNQQFTGQGGNQMPSQLMPQMFQQQPQQGNFMQPGANFDTNQQNFRVDSGPVPELPECKLWFSQGRCARGNRITVGSDTRDIADWCPVSCGGGGQQQQQQQQLDPRFNQQSNQMPQNFLPQFNQQPDQLQNQGNQNFPQFGPQSNQQGGQNFQSQQFNQQNNQQGGQQPNQGPQQQQSQGNNQQQQQNVQQQQQRTKRRL